ncbi:signal peptidase I [Thioclava sp. BHET1]|nr:signal peptidase I [Thioclava sp. BHET1]
MARKRRSKLWARSGMVVFILLVAVLFRSFVLQSFWIPTGSMKDTLLVGDFLLVNKMAYGYSSYSCPFNLCPFSGRILASEPKRGDVVVFRNPGNGEDFIKRLIGLPGDTIQMQQGRLYINGQLVPQKPDGTFEEQYAPQGPVGGVPRCENDPMTDNGICKKDRFRETLPGGVTHDILKITDQGYANNTPVFTVPKGEFFFMGDNRDNSEDSRFPQDQGGVGFVPFKNLIGRADRIMFSSAGRSLFYFWTWRSDRFFKAIE